MFLQVLFYQSGEFHECNILSYYVTSVNEFGYNFLLEIQKCSLTLCTVKIDVDMEKSSNFEKKSSKCLISSKKEDNILRTPKTKIINLKRSLSFNHFQKSKTIFKSSHHKFFVHPVDSRVSSFVKCTLG